MNTQLERAVALYQETKDFPAAVKLSGMKVYDLLYAFLEAGLFDLDDERFPNEASDEYMEEQMRSVVGMTHNDRQYHALTLYKEGHVNPRQAKQLSGLLMADWADLCIAEGLPFIEMFYTVEDLMRDMENIERWRAKDEGPSK